MGRSKSTRSLELVEMARQILSEIQPASVRAVCYRLFTLSLIDSMSKAETNRVSTQLTWAREQGVIPWGWIVDETREPEHVSAWENPAAFIETVQRSYRRDRWTDQPERVEIWSEKGTIRGTLARVLNKYGVTFRVMHGYGSATAVYQAAQDSQRGEKLLTVFYVGDHDPSGLHMSEVDLPRRLKDYGGVVDLIRVALTEQDTRGGLPWFATETKRHDPRFRWYLERLRSFNEAPAGLKAALVELADALGAARDGRPEQAVRALVREHHEPRPSSLCRPRRRAGAPRAVPSGASRVRGAVEGTQARTVG